MTMFGPGYLPSRRLSSAAGLPARVSRYSSVSTESGSGDPLLSPEQSRNSPWLHLRHVARVSRVVSRSPVPGVAVSVLRATGGVVRAALGPGHGLRSVGRRLAAALARACSRPHTSPTCRDSVVVITCTQETRQAEGGGEEQHHHHTSSCAHPGQGSSGH